jgi:TetR/AcrR family transcriptional repressor of nem operon
MIIMRDTYQENKLHILQCGRRLIAQKGFTGVGLSEILTAADVPKGSFYHYFGSKERYGRELIEQYVVEYLQELEQLFNADGSSASARERLLAYWGNWLETQSCEVIEHKCLVVKLSAEVADLSDDMRLALHAGTDAIMARIAALIAEGIAEGSLHTVLEPLRTAQMLYQMWLGASLLSKLSRDRVALESAMDVTRRVLVGP